MLIFGGACIAFRSEAGPGYALQFDGVSAYVQVANDNNLNAFPFTATAWFRTTNSSSAPQGIVSKYVDGTGNGWALILQSGQLRGFYYRNNALSKAIDAQSAALVSDGYWHHAALVVDGLGGKLYLDGIQVGSGLWTSSSGAPVTSAPLLIGRYSSALYPFLGTIDEVTLWSRALGAAEVNYLKHRQLNGNEDGIVGLWHLNDNGQSTTADATGHLYTGTLFNNPVWVASTAPLVFNQISVDALKFSGGNDYVQVAHNTNLNAFPFTATAWFRTTNTSPTGQGIVSKYIDASGDGWAIILQSGKLRGFYYRGGLGNPAIDATSSALVSDGSWHHAALVVDGAGGRLFLDGGQVGLGTWVLGSGAPTTTNALLIGRYYSASYPFLGVIDEVTGWNTSLTPTQLAAEMNQPLTGSESGLVSLWRFDEGLGTNAADATVHGNNGILFNAPVWTGSTAFLGDGTSAIHTTLGAVRWTRQFAVTTIPAQRGFAATAPFWVRRLDDFGAPGGTTSVSVTLSNSLQSALLGGPVPQVNNTTQFNLGLQPYSAVTPQPTAGGVISSPVLDVEPQSGTQLDSVNDTFQLSVTEFYSVNSGPMLAEETDALASAQLLHFDGNLLFGPIATMFTSIANIPTRGSLGGGGINTILAVNNNSGHMVTKPDHTYGNGALLNVVLLSNGDATTASSVTLTGPVPDVDCIQNICFQRTNMSLTATGPVARVVMTLPLGFSIGSSPANHITTNTVPFANVPLDGSLLPTTSSLALSAPLYAIEETLPYWFGASGLAWQISAGQIQLSPNASSIFVRQQEDDVLQSQTNLVDTTGTNRVSNDGYFRRAAPAGGSLVISADSNGIARVATQLTLNPPELRPHFPYAGGAAGAQILTGSGLLIITDNLANASSYLNVAGAVPVSYGRDCTYIGCTAAQAGPATLSFTAAGGQLNFTPDGGLLAYGTVPSANLMWGYATGGNFAQQAGSIGSGAYCMAGTFLRSDQTALTDSQRAAVILFSGFGDASNPAYFERPTLSSYNDGFANYPGLNFRSPTQGYSYVGQHNIGPYGLSSVSKYYVRFGGVNGIHQAGAPLGTLPLYGYHFTFSDYGLSYLDGQNWESVTTGAISFPPQPAGFTQEFDRMKLTCRGDLESAKVPTGSGSKHLAYWNADFTPQSLDFHPTNDDTCGTSTRYLVLGVETKLPFIPQALHAALGFKPNGNLVTVLDNVSNVDSRFEVPAQLSLQGPGSTLFTLSTANEGYFNNWETPGAASLPNGFYNLSGKLRVPFFTDIKVHLQVTPTGPNASQINIMGGWPAPDSTAADLGWSVNNSNYFNMVKFDPNADGWPWAQVSLTDYQRAGPQYRPRAQRDWIQVATFDYPLKWDNVFHSFAGFQDAKVELPVIDVNSRLKELAPGKVDFDFAQDVSLQLPRIKVLDFVNDALNGNIGPLLSVSNAIRHTLGEALDATGINNLSHALREDAQSFFNPILSATIDPAVSNIFPQIAAIQQTNVPAFLQQVYNLISSNSLSNPLQAGIGALNNVSNQASSVVLTLDKTLTDVLNTAGVLDRALTKDPKTGNRPAITTIVEALVNDQTQGLVFLAPLADDAVNLYLTDLDSTLTEIQGDIDDVSNQLAQVQAQLDSLSGDFSQALGSALQDANGLSQFLQAAAANTTNYLASVLTPSGDLFTANPAAVQQAIRQQIATAFLSSVLPGNYQQAFRQFLGDDNFALDELMDQLFDQINSTIRNALTSEITGSQDGIFQAFKGVGLLSGSLASAKIRGAPTFDGDSLRDIHLNAAIQLNMPDKMSFSAYMDVKELTSQSVPVGCIPAGAPAAEVTLGAKQVPLNWAGVTSGQSASSLTLSAEARWTLQNGSVLGIGGTLTINGNASFEGCQLKEIGATLAIGQTENYFASKVDAIIPILGIPVEVQGGFFAGHACTLDPLKFVDPEVEQVLLNNPVDFTGVYLEVGGGFSLSDLLGLGGFGCILNADASITTAYYYQGGASLGTIGGRQKMALDIALLCVLSGHLDFAQFLALDTSGKLTVGGSANVCGSIGPCPFCVSGCKGVTIKGVVTTHGIDYFIDY